MLPARDVGARDLFRGVNFFCVFPRTFSLCSRYRWLGIEYFRVNYLIYGFYGDLKECNLEQAHTFFYSKIGKE